MKSKSSFLFFKIHSNILLSMTMSKK